MSLTTIILLVLALYVVQLFLQETSRFSSNLWGIVDNRDNPPQLSVLAGRLDRAKNNMLEALPLFLGVALLALVKGHDKGLAADAALVFLIARVAYIPAYVSGVPVLRSLIWLVGMASLLVMALPMILDAQ